MLIAKRIFRIGLYLQNFREMHRNSQSHLEDNSVKKLSDSIHRKLNWLGREDGAETIEFIGMFPLVLLTIILIWQFVLLGYTAVVVPGAAREAARAAAVGASCQQAAANASVSWDGGGRRVSCGCGGDFCTAEVELQVFRVPIPLINNLPNYPWLKSKASMRYEPPYR